MGKRLHAEFFVEEQEAGHAIEGCNYLLALDMEMDPVDGYAIASWEQGYGDFDIVPDPATMRFPGSRGPLSCSVMCSGTTTPLSSPATAGAEGADGAGRGARLHPDDGVGARVLSPQGDVRRGLREGLRRAHAFGPVRARLPHPRHHLRRAVPSHRSQPHAGGGVAVETSKGEAWPGQQEINFRFSDALTMADNHVVYKTGAKEIAIQHGCSITFMAKPFEDWIGNSCHVHSSLFRDGSPAFADDEKLFGHWLAGQIACFEELAVFLAPTVNSYKRFAAGSWAPRTLAWGNGNRTCGFRVVGTALRGGPKQDPRWRRKPLPCLRGDHRGRSLRDRARAGAPAAAGGQRLRVRREAISLDAS